MLFFRTILVYLNAPCLYQRFIRSTHGLVCRQYSPNKLELVCNIYFACINIIISSVKATLPIVSYYALSRSGLLISPKQSIKQLTRPLINALLVTVLMWILRGFSRAVNPDFCDFAQKLVQLHNSKGSEAEQIRKMILDSYDFSISSYFPFRQVGPLFKQKTHNLFSQSSSMLWNVQRLFLHAVSYVIYPIAIRLTYIGSSPIISISMREYLLNGRARLITEQGGSRELLRISDWECIDTMFIDRRRSHLQTPVTSSSSCSKLLVCCEGNAGFYEIGCFAAASLNTTSYSMLGWNHAGYAESAAQTSLTNEHYAVQAVMSYAIDILHFREEDIFVYGWSIGGYSAALIAANNPQINAIIMDAVFDDVTPLATRTLPILAPFVQYTMENYINLHNTPLLQQYNGPIRFIRRLGDEIITISPGRVGGNLINGLIINILRHRYPEICLDETISTLQYYLTLDSPLKKDDHYHEIAPELTRTLKSLENYLKDNNGFPCLYGSDERMEHKKALALTLCNEYLVDVNCGHCDTLHPSLFQKPQTIF